MLGGTSSPWGPTAAPGQCLGVLSPLKVLPVPDAVSLPCRGVMLPTDTPSLRQRRQRTATGKHRAPRALLLLQHLTCGVRMEPGVMRVSCKLGPCTPLGLPEGRSGVIPGVSQAQQWLGRGGCSESWDPNPSR